MRAASAARSKRRNRSPRRCGVRGRFSHYSSVQHARPTCDVAVCMSCNKSQDKHVMVRSCSCTTCTPTPTPTPTPTQTHTQTHKRALVFALSLAPCQWKPRLRRTHVCQRLRILATQNSSSTLSPSQPLFFSFRTCSCSHSLLLLISFLLSLSEKGDGTLYDGTLYDICTQWFLVESIS